MNGLKKFLALLLAFTFIFSSIIMLGAVADASYEKGDITKSGDIDMMDYILLKRAYFGTFKLDTEQNRLADLNGSGDIDMLDYILLKRMYFGTFVYKGSDASDDDSSTSSDNSGTSNDTSSDTSGENDDIINGGESVLDNRTLISVGKTYTIAESASEKYPDYFNQQLTDGVKGPDSGAHYTDTRTVGFEGKATVIIDLGDDGKRISDIAVRSLDMSTEGVGLATMLKVYGSDDGEKYDYIGKSEFKSTGDKTMSNCILSIEEPVDYRYLKVVVDSRPGFYFMFMDEIEVYSDIEPTAQPEAENLSYKNENIDKNAWKSLSTGVAADPVNTDNVALHCAYTFANCGFDYRAPENTDYLTDGERTSRRFGEEAWVGIRADGTNIPEVTVQLESLCSTVYSVRVHALGAGIDIKYPDHIDVYGSKNGSQYIFLGRMYAPAKCDNYAYTLLLEEYVQAKYIKLKFPTEEANYWVEEIEVFAASETNDHDKLYPDLCFPTVTEDVYWEYSSDYNTAQNLLIGADQQIAAMYYDSKDVLAAHHVENSPYNFAGLADGKRARSKNCYSGEYFFSHNTSYEVTGYSNCLDFFYDLGSISTIQQLNVHLLENNSIGVTRPSFIAVFLSNDGDHWYKVGDYKMPADQTFNYSATNLSFNFPLDTAYAARFVRFRVEEPKTPRFIFIDELEAIGTKYVSDDTVRITESGIEPVIYYTNDERAQYASTENTTLNSADQVLFIPDYGDKDTLLPLVAHLDENGNITDTMFDGFICWGATSYPRAQYGFSESYKEDWEHLLDITFNGVNGLDRLDEVVGEVKDALNIPDYTVKVYMSTLTLHESVTNFGDIDGDGVSENISVPADRKKVMEWYIDRCTQEFAKRRYKNIVLDGINYIDESVNLENDNSHLIEEFGRAVKAADLNYIWIPFYVAPRFYIGDDLHFDAVCMQVNYVFTNDAPEWRLSSTAEMTKRLGMSIELEHTYQCFGDKNYARQYMKYLLNGVKYGYIDGIQMYFMDFDDYTRMGYSKDPLCRLQYDATYEYIKGTIKAFPEKRAALKLSAKTDTILRGTLNSQNALELYTLTSAPKHGIVALNENGDFVYYPEKGYTGTDSFTYTYNEYLGESEECTVSITIK